LTVGRKTQSPHYFDLLSKWNLPSLRRLQSDPLPNFSDASTFLPDASLFLRSVASTLQDFAWDFAELDSSWLRYLKLLPNVHSLSCRPFRLSEAFDFGTVKLDRIKTLVIFFDSEDLRREEAWPTEFFGLVGERGEGGFAGLETVGWDTLSEDSIFPGWKRFVRVPSLFFSSSLGR